MLVGVDRVCPLLALAADHRSVVDGVDAGHRCHALAEPMPLDREQQARLCLTPRHDHCERYLQHVARRGADPGRASVADGLVSTRLLLAPEPAWRGIAGRARTARSGRALAIGGAVIAVGVAGAALAGPAINGGISLLDAATVPSMTPGASPSSVPSPPPSPIATPSPSPTTAASTTPEPTADPSVAPTAEPTPDPTPTPAPPQQTYVVQEGDTLAEIAAEFGTSVAALQAANGIEDPNEIAIGEVLVIP